MQYQINNKEYYITSLKRKSIQPDWQIEDMRVLLVFKNKL